jgi:hypothetical protein
MTNRLPQNVDNYLLTYVAGQRRPDATPRPNSAIPRTNSVQRRAPFRGQPAATKPCRLQLHLPAAVCTAQRAPVLTPPRHESVWPTSRSGQGSPKNQECTGSAQTHATRGVHRSLLPARSFGHQHRPMLHITREHLYSHYMTHQSRCTNDCGWSAVLRTGREFWGQTGMYCSIRKRDRHLAE